MTHRMNSNASEMHRPHDPASAHRTPLHMFQVHLACPHHGASKLTQPCCPTGSTVKSPQNALVTGAAYTFITSTFPGNKSAADDFLCASNDFATNEPAFNLGAAACRMVLTSRQNDGFNSNNNKTGCTPPGTNAHSARSPRSLPCQLHAGAAACQAASHSCRHQCTTSRPAHRPPGSAPLPTTPPPVALPPH